MSTFTWYTLVGGLKRRNSDRCLTRSISLFMATPRHAHVLSQSNIFFQNTQVDTIAKLGALRIACSN